MPAAAEGRGEIDEEALTRWMREHLLRIAVLPFGDAESLEGLESAVFRRLNPPLNLDKMPPNPVRRRLTELRRIYSLERRRAPSARVVR